MAGRKQPESPPPLVGERRASEANTEAEITRMIQATDDQTVKGLLLILLKMSGNLTENTKVTKEIAETLALHEDRVNAYMESGNKLINRGTGAWMAISLGSVVIWALAGYIAKGVVEEASVQRDKNGVQDVQIQALKGELSRLDGILSEHLRQAAPVGTGK